MTAFNVVRFLVKPGREQEFLNAHRNVQTDWPGLRKVNMIKSGDRSYCIARPTPAGPDYDSTIIGALELSEKKWVLAVRLPRVKRHSRHVIEASGEKLVDL